MCGALEHIKACEKYGLHPIVGMEAYFRADRHAPGGDDTKRYHMVLLASGLQGYKSLMRISSQAHADGWYNNPCIDYELLELHSEGLIATTACVAGYAASHLLKDDDKACDIHMTRMQKIFRDNLYVEIQPAGFEDQLFANRRLIGLANRFSLPIVATVDAHYVNEDESDTHDALWLMSTQSSYQERAIKQAQYDEKPLEFKEPIDFRDSKLFLMDEQRVRDEFSMNHVTISQNVIDTAIRNTELLAESVDPFVLNRSLKLPRIKREKSAEQILREWCHEGMVRIGKEGDREYDERMAYELNVLTDKDVLDYFVIFGEIVRWAKDNGIRVAPGRGSAAGCLVSYLCRITSVDPIAYGLLFERFLNPERKGMPDIDIDFQSTMRQHVRDVFADIHGHENVSDIVAHQTFKAKSAIGSAARVLNVELGEVKAALAGIADNETATLEELLKTHKALTDFRVRHPDVVKHALRLEGQVKARSKHAAGVVITEGPVTEYMPTMRARKDAPIVTAYSDKPSSPIISEYGLLKADFLSTTDLDIQDFAVKHLAKQGITVDLDNLAVMRDPYATDQKTMDLFCAGHTFGLFQFGGSAGITGMMKKMKPKNIHDLAAVNALYRPGALDGGVTDDYFARRADPSLIEYWHPSVEPFLKHTLGVMIYQEQLMQVVQAIGGFTKSQADDMRKATGKLYRLGKEEAREFMQQYHSQWEKGTAEAGIGIQESEDIWQKILAFGGYSFNASHSVCYSLEAYQGAYIKANYPAVFYASIMAADPDKTTQAVREAIARGATMVGPCVNTSDLQMSLSDQGIQVGLISIKDVGDVAAREIMEKRPFADYDDFEKRIEKRRCNVKVKRALFEAGALDCLGALPFTHIDQDAEERDRLGFSLTNNKVTLYGDALSENIDLDLVERAQPGDYVVVGGEVVEIKEKIDKRGRRMCWITLAHGADSWRITVFSSMMENNESMLAMGEVLLASVKVDDRGGFVLNAMGRVEDYMNAEEA